MTENTFLVLYTHQKSKKAKTWHDGLLKHSSGTQRACLHDEKSSRLESIFLKTKEITVGEELESDRYLIQVESLSTTSQPSTEAQPRERDDSTVPVQRATARGKTTKTAPQNSSGLRIGLKRKKTGFVPPRQVKPRVDTDSVDSQPARSNPPRVPPLHGSYHNQAAIPCTGSLNTGFSKQTVRMSTDLSSTGFSSLCSTVPESNSPGNRPTSWTVVGKPSASPAVRSCSSSQDDVEECCDSISVRNANLRGESCEGAALERRDNLFSSNSAVQHGPLTNEPNTSSSCSDIITKTSTVPNFTKRSTSQILSLIGKKKTKENVDQGPYTPHLFYESKDEQLKHQQIIQLVKDNAEQIEADLFDVPETSRNTIPQQEQINIFNASALDITISGNDSFLDSGNKRVEKTSEKQLLQSLKIKKNKPVSDHYKESEVNETTHSSIFNATALNITLSGNDSFFDESSNWKRLSVEASIDWREAGSSVVDSNIASRDARSKDLLSDTAENKYDNSMEKSIQSISNGNPVKCDTDMNSALPTNQVNVIHNDSDHVSSLTEVPSDDNTESMELLGTSNVTSTNFMLETSSNANGTHDQDNDVQDTDDNIVQKARSKSTSKQDSQETCSAENDNKHEQVRTCSSSEHDKNRDNEDYYGDKASCNVLSNDPCSSTKRITDETDHFFNGSACFDINFSPLSTVTQSDDENNIENNDNFQEVLVQSEDTTVNPCVTDETCEKSKLSKFEKYNSETFSNKECENETDICISPRNGQKEMREQQLQYPQSESTQSSLVDRSAEHLQTKDQGLRSLSGHKCDLDIPSDFFDDEFTQENEFIGSQFSQKAEHRERNDPCLIAPRDVPNTQDDDKTESIPHNLKTQSKLNNENGNIQHAPTNSEDTKEITTETVVQRDPTPKLPAQIKKTIFDLQFSQDSEAFKLDSQDLSLDFMKEVKIIDKDAHNKNSSPNPRVEKYSVFTHSEPLSFGPPSNEQKEEPMWSLQEECAANRSPCISEIRTPRPPNCASQSPCGTVDLNNDVRKKEFESTEDGYLDYSESSPEQPRRMVFTRKPWRVEDEDPLIKARYPSTEKTGLHYFRMASSIPMGQNVESSPGPECIATDEDAETQVQRSLAGYLVSGARAGLTVTREVPGTRKTTNYRSELTERQCPQTPDVIAPVNVGDHSTLYHFDPRGGKNHMGYVPAGGEVTPSPEYIEDENVAHYISNFNRVQHNTGAIVNETEEHYGSSQDVPDTTDHFPRHRPADIRHDMLQGATPKQMARKPIKTGPPGDPLVSSTPSRGDQHVTSYRQEIEGRRQGTPVHSQQVPIWMQQSPGDVSFNFTPVHFNKSAAWKRQSGQDSSQESEEFCFRPNFLHQGRTSRNVNECDSAQSKLLQSKTASNLLRRSLTSLNTLESSTRYDARQNAVEIDRNLHEDKFKENEFRTGFDAQLEVRPTMTVDVIPEQFSKWDKFEQCSTRAKSMQSYGRQSHSISPGIRETYSDSFMRHQARDNVQTGIDHLVPVSPANQMALQLNSDDSRSDELCGDFSVDQSPLGSYARGPGDFTNNKKDALLENTSKNQFSAGGQGSFNVEQDTKEKMGREFKAPQFINPLQSSSATKISGFRPPELNLKGAAVASSERNLCSELYFPVKEEIEGNATPVRNIEIPVSFADISSYRRTLVAALTEFINIQLFELSMTYHRALGNIDTSQYQPSKPVPDPLNRQRKPTGKASKSNNPQCEHGRPSKIVQVKKDGPNKGRFFYACNGARAYQCKFFKWADENAASKSASAVDSGGGQSSARFSFSDASSIAEYIKSQGSALYCECVFLRKVPASFSRNPTKIPKWMKNKYMPDNENLPKKMYLKLARKESSSHYSKDDLWVVSQCLEFEVRCTFVARSVFYGPSSSCELEIEPLAGFSPSNWTSGTLCHALHAGSFSNELVCLDTLKEFLQPHTLPLLPHLLSRMEHDAASNRKFQGHASLVKHEAYELIERFSLNDHQASALLQIGSMFCDGITENPDQTTSRHITLIHGVFGAGKSFLLSVVVQFLVRVLEMKDLYSTGGVAEPSKLLIASTTNVAVDRILLCLLEAGFDQFVRVGSVKKIAKPVLPYSVHASGSENQELRELQDMLRSGELSAAEKNHVRRSVEQLRRGENRSKLQQVRVVGATCPFHCLSNMRLQTRKNVHVVGATCAACPFRCMSELRFAVVILDECSQITEPASLLPVARFGSEKLVLVGDPKQLDPTLPGAEPANTRGLEQTLFDRLMQMGHEPVLLRTQYRCHPAISAVANQLFYEGQLLDGITPEDRPPLAPGWPALCFFDVASGQESCESGASFANVKEARFVVLLLEALLLDGVAAQQIGVITLYRAQQSAITSLLLQSSLADEGEVRAIQTSTVDAFQGGERGVIVLSCVRTGSTGFMDNDNWKKIQRNRYLGGQFIGRTNVALTRARNHLLIVGNRRNLQRNSLWGRVLQHCQAMPEGIQNASKFRAMLEQKMQTMVRDTKDGTSKPPKRKRNNKGQRSNSTPIDELESTHCSENSNVKQCEEFKTDTPQSPVCDTPPGDSSEKLMDAQLVQSDCEDFCE